MRILTDTQYIHQLVAEGEHDHQDFKFEISDARKIARSISAFANTGGGRLLVGVKDNGKIAGVRSDEAGAAGQQDVHGYFLLYDNEVCFRVYYNAECPRFQAFAAFFLHL